ncbi:MAG: M14 family metallopeptidase [Candidatus Aminicenantales bacterium]
MRILRSLLPALWLAAVLAVVPARMRAAENGEIVSVTKREFLARGLDRKGLDLLMEKNGKIYIVASPGDLAALFAARVPFSRETDRFFPFDQTGISPSGGLNGAYHSTLELETDLRVLERDHPQMAKVVELGETLEKRKIYALKISNNVSLEENEPAVLLVGCHHAREWISVEVPFLFGKYLLENYAGSPEIQNLVNRSEVWIVPIVNPDGLEYTIHVYRYWRKNRRFNADGSYGVDVNRNYAYQWGYDNVGSSPEPASDVYRGTAPFSEPETDAVRRLFLSRNFRAMISFHSFAQDILYPWGYVNAPTPKEAELDAIARTMSGLIAAVRGTVYAYGRAAGLLYTTNGDTVDWVFGVSGIPGFTIELPPVDVDHGGFFNDEAAIGAIFGENLPAMLYLTDYAIQHPSAPGGRAREWARRLFSPRRLGFIGRIDKVP